MKLPITAIILTYNEEKNIADCLESITKWIDQIIIVDSFSTDSTKEICMKYDVVFLERAFKNYSEQRNWALNLSEIKNEWVLNLDADHRVTTDLQLELENGFNLVPNYVNGLLVSRRTIFMDKWIRWGGHYPTYHCVFFRKHKGMCEEKLYDQHFLVEGQLQKLKGDIIDIFSESMNEFIIKHLKWAELEADYQVNNTNSINTVEGNILGNPIQKRRKLKSFYEKMPLFLRAFVYFFIRYFIRLGFLDGRRGLIFHVLQGFWFRFMVDVKIIEKKIKK